MNTLKPSVPIFALYVNSVAFLRKKWPTVLASTSLTSAVLSGVGVTLRYETSDDASFITGQVINCSGGQS